MALIISKMQRRDREVLKHLKLISNGIWGGRDAT